MFFDRKVKFLAFFLFGVEGVFGGKKQHLFVQRNFESREVAVDIQSEAFQIAICVPERNNEKKLRQLGLNDYK